MDANHPPQVFVKYKAPKGKSVFAARNFSQGETVLVGCRVGVLPTRTMHSIQMDFQQHILLDEPAIFINHCCHANTGIRSNPFGGYDFVALVEIPEGEEITYDYETTETEFAAPFDCLCDDPDCRQQLRGFFHLPLEIRERYGEFIADYLKPNVND